MIRIFVSSVQKELAEERRAVKDFIQGDPLLRRFVADVFLFEDTPARDRQPDNIYLAEVEHRDIYLGLFGYEYGWKNADGKSPTELEFDHATKTGRERLVFVKADDDKARDPDMAKLIRKAGAQLTRRRFSATFEQNGAHFVTTVWRDWLTDAVMDELGLNERQKKGVVYVKSAGIISNPEYQELTDCTKKTATRDLTSLKERVFRQVGTRGPGVHYVLRSKKDIMGT